MSADTVAELMALADTYGSAAARQAVFGLSAETHRAALESALRAAFAYKPVACRYRYNKNARWNLADLPRPGDDTSDVEMQTLYTKDTP